MSSDREAAARKFAAEAETELARSGIKTIRTRVDGIHIEILLAEPPADGRAMHDISARAMALDFDFSFVPSYYIGDDGTWSSGPE